jgi:tetratricopeptide (TPR) repeat protein
MKYPVTLVLLFCLFFTNVSCNEEAYGTPYYDYSAESLSALNLEKVQGRIYDSFVQSLMQRKEDPLVAMKKELGDLYKQNASPLIQYWQGYLQYYYSIYYIKFGDKANSEKAINEGIEILDKISKKNSEDYALLALMQSFSVQFLSGITAGSMSGKVKKNIAKAIKLDDNNLRAYYVAGSNDYYTPEKYGGGKEAEKHLVKAVGLPDQKSPNTTLPSWGKEESYEMLIKIYIKKEDWTNAKKYFQEATTKYPESYTINQLAPKLVGK